VFVPVVALGVVLAVAVAADVLPLWSPEAVDMESRLVPPLWAAGGSAVHPLGTDGLGRDLLSRLIYGARMSLLLSLVIITMSGAVGTAVAVVSGYHGGALDALMSRVIDATLAMPIILVALLFAVILGPGVLNLIVAISLLMWARFARVIRGEVLRIRAQDFIRRAQVTGCSTIRIMARHVLPNVLNTVIVLATIQIGWVIVAESSLSFLGIGIPPPTPSWGSMVAEGRDYLRTAWWLAALPGACITLTVAAVIVLGDWLRDRLDPSLRNV